MCDSLITAMKPTTARENANMFDIEQIEDLSIDLKRADDKIRKTFQLPDDLANPAQTIATLLGLAKSATATAQAIALLLSNAHEKKMLTDKLRKGVE